MLLISVLLPEPLTPVTTTKVDNGKDISTFFKLLPAAPVSCKYFPLPFLLFRGKSIFFFPVKYCPVIELFDF